MGEQETLQMKYETHVPEGDHDWLTRRIFSESV